MYNWVKMKLTHFNQAWARYVKDVPLAGQNGTEWNEFLTFLRHDELSKISFMYCLVNRTETIFLLDWLRLYLNYAALNEMSRSYEIRVKLSFCISIVNLTKSRHDQTKHQRSDFLKKFSLAKLIFSQLDLSFFNLTSNLSLL